MGRANFISRQRWLAIAAASLTVSAGCEESTAPPPVPSGHIVFERTRGAFTGLIVGSSDGDSTVELTSFGEARPAWSPDGYFVAYQRPNLGTYTDIFILRVLDRKEFRVTNSRALSERDPTWSPGGERLAYSGEFFTDGLPVADSIVIANAVGAGATAITSGLDPSWGSDGRIAFVDAAADNGNLPAIWILDESFTRRRASPAPSTPVTESEPAWSADGRLAWTRMRRVRRPSGNDGEEWSIMVQSATGAEPVAIISDTVVVRAPAWSPDGDYLMVTASWRGRPKIWSVRADGDPTTRRRITSAAKCTAPRCADANAVWAR